ncbi:type 4b pilus protein PilO2 [Burkholderia cenocepacia]|uniref:type 4b pilus protein PilO2 n=1 Tax=Burkholderia cenocepacia TaxID=95486 RepID=UPI0013DF965F|nr:type 4b pilus protein PilO2 [Burkholderia cenocepacia]MCW3587391.1 type 4b pilus protein PilO2 [Burkholderia cenocepacia]MCW3632595.1 type 4b pilus protein PilO2 [Burkholderia cenocepacia]MCW5181826.1 type 4b pilus protein PilO2 [Burkholderia cenocepacia]NGO98045.1 hypothetical protein [Burkholderia cenocepacia]
MTEIVTLPGAKSAFAVGLSWRHEDLIPKSKQLRTMSETEGRWGLVRTTSTGAIQVGFCAPVEGYKPRQLKSLAAVVADHHPQPWMGLYKLDNGRYWYIAVRDGQAVIPGGDRIGSFDEMAKIRESHLGYGEWNEIEGTLEDLTSMAQMTPRAVPLRDMQASVVRTSALIGVAVFGIGTLGLTALLGYRHYAEKREQEQLQQRIREYAATHPVTANAPVPPWTREPMPSAVLNACRNAWEDREVFIEGWIVANWTCEVRANSLLVTTDWDRAGGVAANAPGALSADGEKSTDTVEYPTRFGISSARVNTESTAARAIWTLAQTYGIKLELTPSNTTAAALPGTITKTAQSVAWQSTRTKFNFPAPPWLMFCQDFDAVDGLRVTKVTWQPSSRDWITEGTLYSSQASQGARPQPLKLLNPQGAKS